MWHTYPTSETLNYQIRKCLILCPSSRPWPPSHQSELAWGFWLPTRWHWAQLHPVCGGGQQCLPRWPAAWRPGGGHRGPRRDQPQHTGADRSGPDPQDCATEHRSGVTDRTGQPASNHPLCVCLNGGKKTLKTLHAFYSFLRLTSPLAQMAALASPSLETALWWWRTACPAVQQVAAASKPATTSWRLTASQWSTTKRRRPWSRQPRAGLCAWACSVWLDGPSGWAAAWGCCRRAGTASGRVAPTRPWSSTRRWVSYRSWFQSMYIYLLH